MFHLYTEDEIAQAILDYANHHEVEIDAVDVTLNENEQGIIGFRLSLDVGGKSRGCDERFGVWGSTLTATCGDCDECWRGPNAHSLGFDHQDSTGHTVWYDEDPHTNETQDTHSHVE